MKSYSFARPRLAFSIERLMRISFSHLSASWVSSPLRPEGLQVEHPSRPSSVSPLHQQAGGWSLLLYPLPNSIPIHLISYTSGDNTLLDREMAFVGVGCALHFCGFHKEALSRFLVVAVGDQCTLGLTLRAELFSAIPRLVCTVPCMMGAPVLLEVERFGTISVSAMVGRDGGTSPRNAGRR
jgi:hypothetical protein